MRALDPDHFTTPPPAHGTVHLQRPGSAPVEGHASVLADHWKPEGTAPPEGARGGGNHPLVAGKERRLCGRQETAKKASASAESAAISADLAEAAAAEAAIATGSHPPVPGMQELYHLDPGSLEQFTEAASGAERALRVLLGRVGGDCRDGEGSGEGQGKGAALSPGVARPGVASLLTGGPDACSTTAPLVEVIGHVKDKYKELLISAAALGAAMPCAPEGAGG